MPMNPRLLRPRASGVHLEAAAWRTAVVANGGTVSGSTLSAVDKFCKAIDAAGIRDRFYRLNLFCGTGLNACLVPLYRGPSRGGTQYGNTTDTNNGPFVSGDYVETGASGGLKGNATTKYLDTGLTQSTINGDGFGHLSVFARHASYTVDLTYRMIGLIQTSPSSQWFLVDTRRTSGNQNIVGVYGGGSNIKTDLSLSGGQLMLVTRSSASSANTYINATSQGSDTTSRTTSGVNANLYVFAENRVGSGAQTFSAMTLGAYSMGLSLTGSQASSFYTAISDFQTALNRNSGAS